MENFHTLKKIKTLQRGGKSKYVYLMENDIIKKAYLPKDQKQKNRFNTEVKLLMHLEHCPFVPKILKVDESNCVLWMTYVGEPLKETKDNRQKFVNKMKELHLEWNLMRHRDNKPNYHIYIGNATQLNNEVYIIDFGSPHYKIVGPKVISSN